MIKKNTLMEKFNTEVQTGTAKRLFITKGAGRARCCDLRRLAADVLEGETLAPAAQESPREPRVRTTEAFITEENNPREALKRECPQYFTAKCEKTANKIGSVPCSLGVPKGSVCCRSKNF